MFVSVWFFLVKIQMSAVKECSFTPHQCVIFSSTFAFLCSKMFFAALFLSKVQDLFLFPCYSIRLREVAFVERPAADIKMHVLMTFTPTDSNFCRLSNKNFLFLFTPSFTHLPLLRNAVFVPLMDLIN